MTTELERITLRGQTMNAITQCAGCVRWRDVASPTPFYGHSPNQLMILAESPSSLKFLSRLLVEHGLPAVDQWFVAHVVCCAGAAPEPWALRACETHLRKQVQVCEPDWVLTLGATALQAVIPRSKITQAHGRPFHVPAGPFRDAWVMPTYHPSVRAHDDAKLADLNSDLSTLSMILAGELDRETVAGRVGRGGKLVQR